ncbi:hypothetical protein ACTXT7_013469 [Hymenolepis weldensis]
MAPGRLLSQRCAVGILTDDWLARLICSLRVGSTAALSRMFKHTRDSLDQPYWRCEFHRLAVLNRMLIKK